MVKELRMGAAIAAAVSTMAVTGFVSLGHRADRGTSLAAKGNGCSGKGGCGATKDPNKPSPKVG